MYIYKHYKASTVTVSSVAYNQRKSELLPNSQLLITSHNILLSGILHVHICHSELFLHVYSGKVLRMRKKRWTYADVEDISTPKLTPQP